MRYIKVASPKLLREARSVFGSIVTNAWVTTWAAEDDEQSEINDRVSKSIKNIKPNDSGFDFDFETIILEFLGNTQVEIETSEWGYIQKPTDEYEEREL